MNMIMWVAITLAFLWMPLAQFPNFSLPHYLFLSPSSYKSCPFYSGHKLMCVCVFVRGCLCAYMCMRVHVFLPFLCVSPGDSNQSDCLNRPLPTTAGSNHSVSRPFQSHMAKLHYNMSGYSYCLHQLTQSIFSQCYEIVLGFHYIHFYATVTERERESEYPISKAWSPAFGLKRRNLDFKEIRNTDVVILQETWYRGDGPTGCPLGYRELEVPSTKLPSVKQGRESGDMLIW